MMTTTLEDDSRAPLVLLTLEKKGKTINLWGAEGLSTLSSKACTCIQRPTWWQRLQMTLGLSAAAVAWMGWHNRWTALEELSLTASYDTPNL
jgi:hypothetical protein